MLKKRGAGMTQWDQPAVPSRPLSSYLCVKYLDGPVTGKELNNKEAQHW
jgi:hypothetical protein